LRLARRSPAATGRTLITLPAQSVDFQVSQRRRQSPRVDVRTGDRARVVDERQGRIRRRLDFNPPSISAGREMARQRSACLSGQTMPSRFDGTGLRPARSLDSAGIRKRRLPISGASGLLSGRAQARLANFLQNSKLRRGDQPAARTGTQRGSKTLSLTSYSGLNPGNWRIIWVNAC